MLFIVTMICQLTGLVPGNRVPHNSLPIHLVPYLLINHTLESRLGSPGRLFGEICFGWGCASAVLDSKHTIRHLLHVYKHALVVSGRKTAHLAHIH